MLEVSGEFNLRQHRLQRGQFGFGKGRNGARSVSFENRVAEHFVKQTERGAARFLDRLVAAGQPERAQMRDALDVLIRDEEKFAAPDCAVQAVAGAVPRNAERRR